VERRGRRSWRRWCCCPLCVVLLPARSWAGLSSPSWCPPRGVVLLVLDQQAGHLLLWWSGGGWRWLRLALRPAMAPGAVWTLGQQPRDGGHGEEHHGVWCHGGLHSAAATSCKAGLATSSWWKASMTRVWVNSAQRHCVNVGRHQRCHRPWTLVPSLEASSRSSFISLAISSLKISG
jgi:hypothetical protein